MNSKKAITLLILTTLLMTLIPIIPISAAISVPTLEDTDENPITDGVYGDTVVVLGTDGDVPAGTTIELYWDDTTISWNGVKGKLNTTKADSDGSYEIWFDVPEAVNGNHYIWIKAGSDSVSKIFPVLARVKPASSSGLENDRVDVNVYGMSKEKDIGMVLVPDDDIANWNWDPATQVDVDFETGETEYDGTLPGDLILPGSVVITDGILTVTDDGEGGLEGDGDGNINYVTGEWDVDFDSVPADFTIDYEEFVELADDSYLLSGSGTTNIVGSYMKRITVPDNVDYGVYYIATLDAKGVSGADDFTVGAVITATPDEVAVGDRITVKGRGFTESGTISYPDVTIDGIPCLIIDYGDPENIDDDGDFSFEIFVPQVGDEDDYDLEVTDSGARTSSVEIEVTALAKITITPDYGPQGSTVSISGVNFPNYKEDDSITVELTGGDPTPLADPVEIKTFDSNADGTFSGTFRVPAELDGTYDIVAYWPDPDDTGDIPDDTYQADDAFRIGSVLVLLSDDEGPTGLEVILSGNGFTENEGWNATFGGITIFEDETVAAGGLLKQGSDAAIFYVPQVPPGTYDLVVMDEDTEIEVVTEFTVTHTTTFDMMPTEAPSGYNITFAGKYWSEDDLLFEFWVYNDTEEWEITGDVYWGSPGVVLDTWPVADYDYGEFEAWWIMELPNGDDFSKGTYTLNATYGEDYDWIIQTEFVVGDEHVSISPRKSTFRIGDTLSFNIQHSFGNVKPADDGEIYEGVVEVNDPAGNLYFETDELTTWVKSGMFYFVPVAGQTAKGNPMILLDDAPLGTWTYEWFKNDDGDNELIGSGTFTVAPSTEDVLGGKIDDLNNQITDLQSTVSDVTSEFDDIRSDIADVATIAQQAVTAANAVADAVQTVAQTANQANTAAENAAEAANAAKDAANGLTTLVYGAIGAALVAALAAIVSLMQISRRIAG
jgi:hypothetical protein